MDVHVLCPIQPPEPDQAGERIPEALTQLVQLVDGPTPRWRLDLPVLCDDPDSEVIVQMFLHWRAGYEAVFSLGPALTFGQFSRIARSLVEAEGVPAPELSIPSDGGTVQGDGLEALLIQLDAAEHLLGEVATPGWLLQGSSGTIGRRDLSLGGTRVLADVGDAAIGIDPQEGYVLWRNADLPDAAVRVDSFDGTRRAALLADGSRVDFPPSADAALAAFFGLRNGAWTPAQTSAADVFGPQCRTLRAAVSYAGRQPSQCAHFYDADVREPVYLSV